MAEVVPDAAAREAMVKEALAELQFDSDAVNERLQEFRDKLPADLDEAFDELVGDFVTRSFVEGVATGYSLTDVLVTAGNITAARCEQCGKPFLGKRTDKRFCGDTCRVQADRAKNR